MTYTTLPQTDVRMIGAAMRLHDLRWAIVQGCTEMIQMCERSYTSYCRTHNIDADQVTCD